MRQEHDFPPELIFYRIVALTGWTAEEYRAQSESVINDLYAIDQIARTNDSLIFAKMLAGELARIIAPLLGAKMT